MRKYSEAISQIFEESNSVLEASGGSSKIVQALRKLKDVSKRGKLTRKDIADANKTVGSGFEIFLDGDGNLSVDINGFLPDMQDFRDKKKE